MDRASLYSGEVTGTIVELPQWRYPVVFNCQTGDVKYDNFEGRWGDQKWLDQFLQTYAVEKVKRESRLKGYSVTERSLADGSIKLTVNVEGGA